ncbi:unnamed protein product [Durusdinium trenchii]|uniref:Transmembrane protein n=1 Tax=Durusdinium trenchii TaxID=1381693 RepID=A0ABP0RE83_9DINO
MDNWMRYQLTGDERYIQAFRRQKALKAALMGGSLGAIGCVSASIMASQVMAKDWPPPTLPKRCGAFLLGFGAISGIYSWIQTRHLVGELTLPQMEGIEEKPTSHRTI